MKIVRFSVVLFLILAYSFTGNGQNLFEGWEHLFQKKREYLVYQTNETINIDGIPNEQSWEKAKWTSEFLDIEGENKEKPKYPTRVKMLWDKNNLYLLAELTEPHIWAYYDKHDMIVFHENDFEVFIDPDRNNHEYFEFEINAQNTLFDLFLTRPYRNGGNALISWDAPGYRSAVFLEGTLNNPNDIDKKWTIEMAIPFRALRLGVHPQIPADGTCWHLNFSRVEWMTDSTDDKYERKKDNTTGKILPENNWVWSPIGVINMHYPERWGILQFSDETVGEGKKEFRIPPDEKYRDLLWLLYYKQFEFRNKNKIFASSLKQLSFPEKPEKDAIVTMKATDVHFFARIETSEGLHLSINHEGEIFNFNE